MFHRICELLEMFLANLNRDKDPDRCHLCNGLASCKIAPTRRR